MHVLCTYDVLCRLSPSTRITRKARERGSEGFHADQMAYSASPDNENAQHTTKTKIDMADSMPRLVVDITEPLYYAAENPNNSRQIPSFPSSSPHRQGKHGRLFLALTHARQLQLCQPSQPVDEFVRISACAREIPRNDTVCNNIARTLRQPSAETAPGNSLAQEG